jgi:hypothetical protein
MDVSSISLSLHIIELSQKLNELSFEKQGEYITYIRDEFFAIDDEFSYLFEIIIEILKDVNNIETKLENIINDRRLDISNFELCVKACLDYLKDI